MSGGEGRVVSWSLQERDIIFLAVTSVQISLHPSKKHLSQITSPSSFSLLPIVKLSPDVKILKLHAARQPFNLLAVS